MPAERAHTFLATPSRMQNHRSKERRAAQRRLYSRLSTLKRRTSCGRGTPCVNTFSEAIASIMLRETPDDRRVAAPGLHLTHGRVTIVVVWKRFVKKMNLLRILYLQFFLNEIAVFSVYFRGLFYYWPTPIVLPPNGWPQARWRITAHERRSGVLGGSPPVTTRHHGVTTRHHPSRAVTGRHLRQTRRYLQIHTALSHTFHKRLNAAVVRILVRCGLAIEEEFLDPLALAHITESLARRLR